jgi:hypothetical protein
MSFLTSLFRSSWRAPATSTRPRCRRAALTVEYLEGRALPSATSLLGSVVGPDSSGGHHRDLENKHDITIDSSKADRHGPAPAATRHDGDSHGHESKKEAKQGGSHDSSADGTHQPTSAGRPHQHHDSRR